MTMPKQKPGKSLQSYGTPDDFIKAVELRFGQIWCDLAASAGNAVVENFIDEEHDSLSVAWRGLSPSKNLWLNPPYNDIGKWAKKARDESEWGAKVMMLVPASIGSNWYRDYVRDYAYVLALNPRLTFKGCKTPYPKDCILACYLNGFIGFDTWTWK